MIAFQAQLGQDHTLSQRKEFERVKARKAAVNIVVTESFSTSAV